MQDTNDTFETDDCAPALPPTWARVVGEATERYGNTRCEHWQEELVFIRDGLPMAVPYPDPVLDGFARKTAKRLCHICSCCGRPAKPRPVQGGWQVNCSSCWGKSQLTAQIEELLDEAQGMNLAPFDGKPALWHEHEMALLLRSCIPSFCWRNLDLPQGGTMRYLAREDVSKLAPWLRKVQRAMRNGPPVSSSTLGT